jgi:hypothetical protein
MTHGRANAVIASVATSDHDDVLAPCIDICTILELRVQKRLRIQLLRAVRLLLRSDGQLVYLKILHCEVNAVRLTIWNLQVPWPGCSCTKDDGVIFSPEFSGVDVDSHVGVGNEGLKKQGSLPNAWAATQFDLQFLPPPLGQFSAAQ